METMGETSSEENKENNADNSADQERLLLETIPIIKRIAGSKLSTFYHDSIEDITQKVLLKLWKWKNNGNDKTLTGEEWKKLANTATQNEVSTFYSHNSKKETRLSDTEISEELFFKVPTSKIEGNTELEVYSILVCIWKVIQSFTLRQKYSILLQNQEFIVDLITTRCCKISDIASSLMLEKDVLAQLIRQLPLPDEEICKVFETATGEKITPKQMWESRSKAKVKLLAELKKLD
jgi:DNA-directed RNA polymerase specialized sigma24 family protein